MIELPEAQTLARQFIQAFAGKTVVEAVAASSPHGLTGFGGDPSALRGKTVTGAHAYGGQPQMEMEDMLFTFFDGVNARLVKPGEPVPERHQYLIAFDDGSRLVCTVSMYAGFNVRRRGEDEGGYTRVAKERPSPLTDAFHLPYFENIVDAAKKNLSVKALLATEQRIPGLGNGVLQDILFRARINPRRKSSTLLEGEVETLFEQVKETLRLMTEGGGRDTEKDLYGSAGGYHSQLSAKTWKSPCPVCGDTIVRQAYLGGNVYFCPTCQPLG